MAIANLAQHESNMIYWLGLLRDSLGAGSPLNAEQKLANCYYDAQRAFYQCATYTGDTAWNTAATLGQAAYGTAYVDANNGQIPGFWSFTQGLTEDYLLTGDQAARNSVNLITSNAAFHTTGDTSDDLLSRENAYALIAHINNVRCGQAANTARITTLYNNAISHIDQWCTSLTADYFRPFMGALTARALIHYFQYYNADSAIVTALGTMADYMHTTCWNATAASWTYTDRDVGSTDPVDRNPQPDLNLLIVPYLGWLWWRTGDPKWLTRGDAAFDGGVSFYDFYSGVGYWNRGAYLGGTSMASVNGKHVCQNFTWSSEYLDYRLRTPVGGQTEPNDTIGTIVLYDSYSNTIGTSSNQSSDTFKMILLANTYVPSQSHTILADITAHEVSGNGYARQTLTATFNRSTATTTFDISDATFSASGGDIDAYWYAIYNDTLASDPLVCYGRCRVDEDDSVKILNGSGVVIGTTTGIFQINRT